MRNISGYLLTEQPILTGNSAIKAAVKGQGIICFLFKKDDDYFYPSEKQVMINLIVKDLFGLLDILKEEGVRIVGEPLDEEYGKFGWIIWTPKKIKLTCGSRLVD
ncbi:MAG TPA: hypothetical protein VN451_09455 [Chitinophagaceae bacterium]|nr:hypothetical protein [Chitinophagaceae bacterium]